MPKFSIILPTHNGAERISKALDSCFGQKFDDYEIIVILDSCNDNTEKIVTDYYDSRVKTIITDCRNDGAARNKGLDIATGDWILFLDDDDWWMHEYVFPMLARLTEAVGKDTDAIFFSLIKRNVGYIKQTATSYDPLTAGHCWKRSFIGDTRFPAKSYGSDNDFFFRLLSKEPEVVFWDNPLYYYNYMREGSLSDRHNRGEV